jgi:hypothetical protein
MPCFVMPLRTYDISKMMPIISEAINIRIKRTKQSTVSSKCKSINCLLIVLILLFKQMKKIKRAQRDLNVANDQLSA